MRGDFSVWVGVFGQNGKVVASEQQQAIYISNRNRI